VGQTEFFVLESGFYIGLASIEALYRRRDDNGKEWVYTAKDDGMEMEGELGGSSRFGFEEGR